MPGRRTDKPTRMLGVHLTEAEHATVKALAAATGETISVLFRTWLREQAKRKGIAA
jgi:hypothetical protein